MVYMSIHRRTQGGGCKGCVHPPFFRTPLYFLHPPLFVLLPPTNYYMCPHELIFYHELPSIGS